MSRLFVLLKLSAKIILKSLNKHGESITPSSHSIQHIHIHMITKKNEKKKNERKEMKERANKNNKRNDTIMGNSNNNEHAHVSSFIL